jgi:hypothetical protein
MRFVYQHGQGWPEPYIYTVYDRMFGEFPAKNNVHTPYIYMVLANATNAVCVPAWSGLARTVHIHRV